MRRKKIKEAKALILINIKTRRFILGGFTAAFFKADKNRVTSLVLLFLNPLLTLYID